MQIGDIVTYTGASDEQKKWGNYTGNWDNLHIGVEYKISNIDVHSWHTKVSLENIDGTFNSVCFKPY